MAEPEDKLAEELDRELKRLPDLPAPESIAANVLSTIKRWESRPWWQRSWFEWPMTLRYASIGLFIVALFGIHHFGADVEAHGALQPLLAVVRAFEAVVMLTISTAGSWLASIPLWVWGVLTVSAAMAWTCSIGVFAVSYQLIRTRK